MRKLSECYDVHINGDKLTDAEALALRDKFKQVADASIELGQRFRLAFLEANTQYMALDDICAARGI